MGKLSYTKDQMIAAVQSSISVAEVLLKLGMNERNGHNYVTFHKYRVRWEVDVAHFKGKAHGKGRPRKEIEDLLGSSSRLKKQLLKRGIKKEECESCELSTWMGEKIPLTLHHVDGDSHNNARENVKILCWNCHALTPNFGIKNKVSTRLDRRYGRGKEMVGHVGNAPTLVFRTSVLQTAQPL